MPQPRIGIGTPFQGLWNAVAFPRALPRAKVGTPLRGLGCRMHRSKRQCRATRQSKSAVVDFDINSAHRVSPRNDEAKRINRKAHPIGKLINRKTHQSIGASIDRRINGASSGACGSAHARRSRPVSRRQGRHRPNAGTPKTAEWQRQENVRRNVREQSRKNVRAHLHVADGAHGAEGAAPFGSPAQAQSRAPALHPGVATTRR
jgi:hypothetical protein